MQPFVFYDVLSDAFLIFLQINSPINKACLVFLTDSHHLFHSLKRLCVAALTAYLNYDYLKRHFICIISAYSSLLRALQSVCVMRVCGHSTEPRPWELKQN